MLCGAATLVWVALAAYHAVHVYLLADDFAIVAQASDATFRQIFTTDLFSFYRPLGAALVKAVEATLSPSPTGWSLLMLAIHVGNAALVAGIARRLFGDRRASWLAGVLFLLSPWAAEGYLWLGPVFDVGATACTLLAVRLALAAVRLTHGATVCWVAVAGSCACAAGFKESGLLSPVIVAGVLLVDDPQVWRSARAWAAGALAMMAVLLVFFIRSTVVVATSTYTVGGYIVLLSQPGAGASFMSALLALMVWPVPNTIAPAGPWMNILLVWPVGFALVPVLVASLLIQARRTMPLAVVTAVGYLPTAFFHLTVASITPRRYLYLVGATWALLVGGAMARLRVDPGKWAPAMVVMTVVFAAGLTSLTAQVVLWAGASRIARCAIEDFGQTALGRDGPLFVDNVPFVVDSGPFILLDYGFHYAYRPQWDDLDVVYRMVSLHVDERGQFVVSGQGSEPAEAEGRERISLDLCLNPLPGGNP